MVAILALGAGAAYVMVLIACVHAKFDLGSLAGAYITCLTVFVMAAAVGVASHHSVATSALAGVIALTSCLVPLAIIGNRPSRPNTVWDSPAE